AGVRATMSEAVGHRADDAFTVRLLVRPSDPAHLSTLPEGRWTRIGDPVSTEGDELIEDPQVRLLLVGPRELGLDAFPAAAAHLLPHLRVVDELDDGLRELFHVVRSGVPCRIGG